MVNAFIYHAVDVNKIIVISSFEMPSYLYAQVTKGQNYILVDSPIHGEHLKLNPN